MIKIKGFMKTSLLDYPGKIASVVFLPKCNFHCGFCHNKELVLDDTRLVPFEIDTILDFLKSKKKWVDGVVITGGEPTLHKGIGDFCKAVKKLGFAVKLDTNGTNPKMLKQLIDEKLVDYVAMDIKTSKEKYEKAASVKVNIKIIEESMRILKCSDVEYEFRTTVLPGIVDEKDMEKIGKWIKGAKRFYIQQFVPIKTLNDSFMKVEPYSHSVLHSMCQTARKYVDECGVRGI
ncbi:anaerobic ribonucleoside-triphosphate reductase activating protein [Candidatus Woesearchaeota archaeon]|nr:anaerobic ribonucleoside-triphosphate reductase activating protein [Candidatus Woesearchaeota archaeon]